MGIVLTLSFLAIVVVILIGGIVINRLPSRKNSRDANAALRRSRTSETGPKPERGTGLN